MRIVILRKKECGIKNCRQNAMHMYIIQNKDKTLQRLRLCDSHEDLLIKK